MTDNNSANPFEKEGGNPAISFSQRDEMGSLISKPKGTKIGGKVVGAPKLIQQRDFNTKLPAWWDAEKLQPKMSVVTELDVNGVTMSLWARKPSDLFAAINKAMNDTGGAAIAVGDTLIIELVGATQGEDASKAPAKNYVAHLTRGGGAFTSEAPATATPAAAPPPPPAAAAPPPPPPAPAWAGQAERDAFLGAGWTPEQIAQHHPHLVPPAAPAAPPAPPAPPAAAPAVDARAAAIAAMSPEDRALLNLG